MGGGGGVEATENQQRSSRSLKDIAAVISKGSPRSIHGEQSLHGITWGGGGGALQVLAPPPPRGPRANSQLPKVVAPHSHKPHTNARGRHIHRPFKICAPQCARCKMDTRVVCHRVHFLSVPSVPMARDALEGKGPQRRPQERLGRRLEEVAKAVGGGYCRLQMPLKLALGVRETVAGRPPVAVRRGHADVPHGGPPPQRPVRRLHEPPPPPTPRCPSQRHTSSGRVCGAEDRPSPWPWPMSLQTSGRRREGTAVPRTQSARAWAHMNRHPLFRGGGGGGGGRRSDSRSKIWRIQTKTEAESGGNALHRPKRVRLDPPDQTWLNPQGEYWGQTLRGGGGGRGFQNCSFAKRPRVAHMFNLGWWRLAVGGWWQLVAVHG